MRNSVRPPRAALLLLNTLILVIHICRRSKAISIEEFCNRARTSGARAARCWSWREALRNQWTLAMKRPHRMCVLVWFGPEVFGGKAALAISCHKDCALAEWSDERLLARVGLSMVEVRSNASSGCSSVGRALVSQTKGRGIVPRHPLQSFPNCLDCAQRPYEIRHLFNSSLEVNVNL